MGDIPLPIRVAAELRQKIQEGEFKIGQRLPSERLLAEQMDVSRQVIRQAINDLCRFGMLDCQPRCRPVVIAGPKTGPRGTTRDSRIYLLVFPYVSDFISSQLLKGVRQGITEPGINLAISPTSGGKSSSWVDDEREELLRIAGDPMACGVIVWYIGGQRNVPALQAVREAGIPIVFVDRASPDGFEADFVGTDNLGGARAAVKHLIELGHKRIGMLTNLETVSSVQERQTGYKAALADAGLPFRPELLVPVDLDTRSFDDAVADSMTRLLRVEDPPTAVFAVNDQIALRMIPILAHMGIQIPEQLSLVGFDGWLRWLPGGGKLTSAAQQFERIGCMASELILRRLHHGEPNAYRHIILEAPLVLNDSTCAPATNSA